MISGKKPFVAGKPFKYPKFEKASDNRKGKSCTKCGKYRLNINFSKDNEECNKCMNL